MKRRFVVSKSNHIGCIIMSKKGLINFFYPFVIGKNYVEFCIFFFEFQNASYDFFYTIFVNRIVFLLVYNFQFHHKLGWVLKDKTQRLLFFTHPLIPSQEGIFIITLLRGVGVCLSIAYRKGWNSL